jgi:hypothetical protein
MDFQHSERTADLRRRPDEFVDRHVFPVEAFAMFRQAAMSTGLKRRAELGTAVDESAWHFGNTLDVFACTGLHFLQRGLNS